MAGIEDPQGAQAPEGPEAPDDGGGLGALLGGQAPEGSPQEEAGEPPEAQEPPDEPIDVHHVELGDGVPACDPSHDLLNAIEQLAKVGAMAEDAHDAHPAGQAAMAFAQAYVYLHPELSPVVVVEKMKEDATAAQPPEPSQAPTTITEPAVGMALHAISQKHGIPIEHLHETLHGAQLHLKDLTEHGTPEPPQAEAPGGPSAAT